MNLKIQLLKLSINITSNSAILFLSNNAYQNLPKNTKKLHKFDCNYTWSIKQWHDYSILFFKNHFLSGFKRQQIKKSSHYFMDLKHVYVKWTLLNGKMEWKWIFAVFYVLDLSAFWVKCWNFSQRIFIFPLN